MVGFQLLLEQEKVQTNKFCFGRSSESYSGKHNPKVVGSNPTPATKYSSDFYVRRIFVILETSAKLRLFVSQAPIDLTQRRYPYVS